ncbi:hypothetical protein CORC01_13808 [Colletotrichum orchidophilum]|uniref:Uncharacterized protein n=1 Tax=Colletotrichum orchidophilum TaxID=1209926 RepID=A0A1G4APB0_9PEZI|nr:uncharacterized protein CORC01_13808 [Colletotrichum orchidophilum]OHE90893.1 hypothetical protein CORC01_13808 [Colletotrichum orchidophilum]
MPSQTSTLTFLTLALAAATSAVAIPVEALPTTITPTSTSTTSSVPTTSVLTSSNIVAPAPSSTGEAPLETPDWNWAAGTLALIERAALGDSTSFANRRVGDADNKADDSSVKDKETESDFKEEEIAPTPSSTAIPTEALAWDWAAAALAFMESNEFGDATSFANRRVGAESEKEDESNAIEETKGGEDAKPLDEAAKESIGNLRRPSLPLQTASPEKEEQIKPTKSNADFTILTQTSLLTTVATPSVTAQTPTSTTTMEVEPTKAGM